MNIRLASNLKTVTNRISKALFELEQGKYLRVAAFDAAAIVQDRVQQRGEGVKGSLGDYSASYVKVRRKRGRQVEKKDLTFEGDLFRNWIVAMQGKDAVVGFGSKRESDKGEYLETYAGQPIFELSQKEEDFVMSTILKAIDAIFK